MKDNFLKYCFTMMCSITVINGFTQIPDIEGVWEMQSKNTAKQLHIFPFQDSSNTNYFKRNKRYLCKQVIKKTGEISYIIISPHDNIIYFNSLTEGDFYSLLYYKEGNNELLQEYFSAGNYGAGNIVRTSSNSKKKDDYILKFVKITNSVDETVKVELKNFQNSFVIKDFNFISGYNPNINNVGSFSDKNSANVLTTNSQGIIRFNIYNQSRNTLKAAHCYCRLDTSLEKRGVRLLPQPGDDHFPVLNIAPGMFQTISIPIQSFSDLPDQVPVFCSIETESLYFATARYDIPVEGFFPKQTLFALPHPDDARTKALDLYFGKEAFNDNECRSRLEALMNAGDSKAAMWLSIFTCTGRCGISRNEDLALKIALDHNVFPDIKDMAQKGDVEAIYLLANAVKMGIKDNNSPDTRYLFRVASEHHYLPAEAAFLDIDYKDYKTRDASIKELYNKGFNFGGLAMAQSLESDLHSHNPQSTPEVIQKELIKIYQRLAGMGSIDAMLKLSEMQYEGKIRGRNVDSAILLANKAVAKGSTVAMVYLANILVEGKFIEKDPVKAQQLLLKASNYANRDAMMALGLLLFEGKVTGVKENISEGLDWIQTSADLGNGTAMHFLSTLYATGNRLPKSIAASRYWLTEASKKGVGPGVERTRTGKSALESFAQGFENYEPHYYYEVRNQYNDVIERGYEDGGLLSYVGAGVIQALIESKTQKQQIINDVARIRNAEGNSTYVATITSGITINNLRSGQVLNITAFGNVSVGSITALFNGTASPDGISGSTSNNSLSSHSLERTINHGALIMRMNDGSWKVVGNNLKNYVITENGTLTIAVNDREYQNNEGYFDVKIGVQ